MLVLAIDTSNNILSVALVHHGQTLIEITEATKNNHSERLMPVIEQAFKAINHNIKDIDLIAVAAGPGSYTGVRIGVTVAKTLAWTLNKPLVSMSSLEVLARNLSVDGLIIPLFDARRQSVFAGVYHGVTYETVIADGHYSLEQLLASLNHLKEPLYFVGADVEPYWGVITEVLGFKCLKAHATESNIPHAEILAKAALLKEPIQNVHTLTPNYHRLPEAEVNWLQQHD